MTEIDPTTTGSENEILDVSMCIANTLGLAKMGNLTNEEIDVIVDSRDSVGKGNRSRYGRLLCQFSGCDVACNVELEDGIPTEKNTSQLVQMLGGCVVLRQTTAIQPCNI
jgi:hypothetical protein